MAITINGSANTVAGLAVGGLPDGVVDADTLASNSVTNVKVADDAIGIAELSTTGTAGSGNYLRGDNAWTALPDSGKVLNWNTKTNTTAVSYSNAYTNHTVWTSDALTVTSGSTILVIASYHVWKQDALDADHYGKIAIEQEIGGSGTWTHIKGVGTAGYQFGSTSGTLSYQHNYHQSWTHGQSTGTSIKIRLRDEVQSPEENLVVFQRNGNGSCLTLIEVAA